jgi:rSAM/selenodomain-associated transferase 1
VTRGPRRLGIFYKPPVPGRVKTRLVPPLTPHEAAELYAAFLDDTLTLARRTRVDEIILFDAGDPPGWVPPGGRKLRRLDQRGPDLGARMSVALEELLVPGPGNLAPPAAILLGSDAPTLPPSAVEDAFELLESGTGEIVLGPSPDGGYVLIGVCRVPGELLRTGIAWSTESTLRDTETRARELGWRVAHSPGGADVDTPGDLLRLLGELEVLEASPDRSTAPRSRSVLPTLRERIRGGADSSR